MSPYFQPSGDRNFGKGDNRLPLVLAPIRRRCARWARDNLDALQDAEPDIPGHLFNRPADNWRPLLAIADLASGDWPARARRAALILSAGRDAADDTYRVQALEDIRALYEEQGTDRISSKGLVEALRGMDDRPWADWNKGRGLSTNSLAQILGDFGIKSRTIRQDDGSTPKGYRREQFEGVWESYLSPGPPSPNATSPHRATEAEFQGESPDRETPQGGRCGVSGSADPGPNSTSIGECGDVAFQKPPAGPGEKSSATDPAVEAVRKADPERFDRWLDVKLQEGLVRAEAERAAVLAMLDEGDADHA